MKRLPRPFVCALAGLAALLAAAPASAVNKCVVQGRTVYQDAPCPRDAQASSQVDTSGAGQADFGSLGALHAQNLIQRAQTSYNVSMGRVAVGMTQDEALAAWGSPSHVNRSVGRWGRHDQWVYRGGRGGRDSRYVYVENGVVTSIQGPGWAGD